MHFFKTFFNFLKTLFSVIFITFLITLTIDFFFGKLIINKLNTFLSNTNFYERLIRQDHNFYHHTLKKNVKYEKARSFSGIFTLCTDNHGFKYKCGVKRDKSFEIAFIGDSFVEGVALEYEKTFVGLFEDVKKTSVANLGVTSYAPNIYLSKTKYLLDEGFNFKHLIVFIDVSDLYDDNTFYKLNKDFSVSEKNAKKKRLKLRKFLRTNFPLTNYYMYVIKMNNRLNNKTPPIVSDKPIFNVKAALKAKWTYSDLDQIDGFDESIKKTKTEMLNTMNELYKILNTRNIKLSIVVYPWPQQLQNDKQESVHVKMWEKFCEKKCYKFINFFPFFFKEKEKNSFLKVYKKYYFWNDVHFNAEGNRIIADRLIKEF